MAGKKTSETKIIRADSLKEDSIKPNDLIETSSVTAGELVMIGRKTRRMYRWKDYGDTAYVEYQDLVAECYSATSRYLFDPLFVINSSEVIEQPLFKKVADLYKNVLSAEEIDKLFNLDLPSFEKTLQRLPKGLRNSVKAIAADKIMNGSLDSINKIKAIDSILGSDLFNSYIGG